MCFNFKLTKDKSESGRIKSRPPKYKIAEEDIKVYKTLRSDDRPIYVSLRIANDKGWIVIEPYTRGFEYEELDFVQKALYWNKGYTSFGIAKSGRYNITKNAFHTCKTRDDAKTHIMSHHNNRKIVEMIIPKGAFYYENDEEYVSNRVIYPEM
jgi:hypothetical protein